MTQKEGMWFAQEGTLFENMLRLTAGYLLKIASEEVGNSYFLDDEIITARAIIAMGDD